MVTNKHSIDNTAGLIDNSMTHILLRQQLISFD